MTHSSLRIIGLTGGIACGKSTVSDYLQQAHDCTVLDADIYARAAVTSPSALLNLIRERYGDGILTEQGDLDRLQLGNIIFDDESERQWLERIIHPYVRQHLIQDRDRYQQDVSLSPELQRPLIMVIPLLFESHMEDLVTEIWVVSCSAAQQRQRLMARNGLSAAQAEARIQSQWPLAEKIKHASVVIDNSGDRAQIYRQVDVALRAHHSDDSG